MEPDTLFSLNDLHFAYGDKPVLKGLQGNIKKGKVTTLIGANGCGKSTLLNLITRNLTLGKGEILLEGTNITSFKPKEYAKQVAIVHQYNTAPPDLTVEKLVGYGRTPYRSFGMSTDPKKDLERVDWAIDVTCLCDLRDTPVDQLSGGQKQRAWIAMALAQDTKVLLLDEPTTYLDIRYQLDILHLVRTLNYVHGLTIVMVLHDINQALYYSDEILAMKDGNLLAAGAPEEIITAELVEEIYEVPLELREVDGKPFVLPI